MKPLDQLETPIAAIDLDQMMANIQRFQEYCDAHHIANRPHIKTHKTPEIAWLQLNAGAVGITCQKLGEAEVMVDAGIRDVFIPYNLVGDARLERLSALLARATLSVTADSATVVEGLARAARRAGVPLTVLVEFESGGARCGVQTPAEAAGLARTIAACDDLRFGGLMTYPTSPQSAAFVRTVRAILAPAGIDIARVSGGSTRGMWQAHEHPEVTEHRAGMYIFGDRYTIANGAMTRDTCSFTVITTVVSRPTADRGVIDGGSKTFSSDLLGLSGHGLILEYPEAQFTGMSEEHGIIDFGACARRPVVGDRLTIIPNHCCPVVNLFDELVGHRAGVVDVVWPVAARGAIR